MNRLIIAGTLAIALTGFGTDRVLHEIHSDSSGGMFEATGGPTVPYTPKSDPPCARDISSAKAAVTSAQGMLTYDHDEARISASQLKTLSDDLGQEAKSAEQAQDWPGICADISQVESRAAAE